MLPNGKGFELVQGMYKKDGTDMTIDEAIIVIDAFFDICDTLGLVTGGHILAIDADGEIIRNEQKHMAA